MSRILFRKASQGIAALAIPSTFFNAKCDAYPFDTKGFPTQSSDSLALAGVGMRRKNFYIVEVDVYQTALNLSSSSIAAAKTCHKQAGTDCDMAGFIYNAVVNNSQKGNADATVTLRFVRAVGKDQVVEAFNEAFVGLDPSDITKFKSELSKHVGENGMQIGEEIKFSWLSGGGLAITKGGAPMDTCYRNTSIEKRLLEVYVDSKRSVAPELVKCVHDHIESI